MEYRDKCPSSFSEVENASRRLGCGNDKFGNNQYLCLPTAEKDSLIEFCHTGIMGLQEKGNCLESSNGELILENCTHFVFGCPEEHFKSSEIFKYPACQAINRNLRCYMLDPLCQPTGGDDACSNDGMVHWNVSIPIYVAVFCISVAVGFLVFAVRRKYRKSFKGNWETAAEFGCQLSSMIHGNKENDARFGSQLSMIHGNREYEDERFGSRLSMIHGNREYGVERFGSQLSMIHGNREYEDERFGSRLSMIHDGTMFSDEDFSTLTKRYEKLYKGKASRKKFFYKNGSISSNATSNMSDPTHNRAYGSISSNATSNMSDPTHTNSYSLNLRNAAAHIRELQSKLNSTEEELHQQKSKNHSACSCSCQHLNNERPII